MSQPAFTDDVLNDGRPAFAFMPAPDRVPDPALAPRRLADTMELG